MTKKRGFGSLRKLPSGRYQARYIGPDGHRYSAAITFQAQVDAEAWLTDEHRLIEKSHWSPPTMRAAAKYQPGITFHEYADDWLATHHQRNGQPIKDRTRAGYRQILDSKLIPSFGDVPVKSITEKLVNEWHAAEGTGTPTYLAKTYSLLHSILKSATIPSGGAPPLLAENPCKIIGGTGAVTSHRPVIAKRAEVHVIADNMPPRHKLAVLLMYYCQLRFGECIALRRNDIDRARRIVAVTKGIVLVNGVRQEDTTKNGDSRFITYPKLLDETIRDHLERFAQPGPRGLLFPNSTGSYLAQSTFNGRMARTRRIKGRLVNESPSGFQKAIGAAGLTGMHVHDLRHSGSVLTASTGATLIDMMARHGHKSTSAELRYQHAAQENDRAIADAFDQMEEPH